MMGFAKSAAQPV